MDLTHPGHSIGTNTNAPKPSIFGTQPGQTTGFGSFGLQQPQNQQGQQNQQPSGGLFSGGLFGPNNQQQQQPQQAQQQSGGCASILVQMLHAV